MVVKTCLMLLAIFVTLSFPLDVGTLKSDEINSIVVHNYETNKHLIIKNKTEINTTINMLSHLNTRAVVCNKYINFFCNDGSRYFLCLNVFTEDSIVKNLLTRVNNEHNWFYGWIQIGPRFSSNFTFDRYDTVKQLITNKFKWDDEENSIQSIFPTIFVESTEKAPKAEVAKYQKIKEQLQTIGKSYISNFGAGSWYHTAHETLYYHSFKLSFEKVSDLGKAIGFIGGVDDTIFFIDSIRVPSKYTFKFWFESPHDSVLQTIRNIKTYFDENNVHVRTIWYDH